MMYVKAMLNDFFNKGHERTLKAKKNIFISFILKGGSIIIGLILVPLTINYVNPSQYGIWLTLSSIISWFAFFDIGLGNGLKNKLAASNATGEVLNSKIYVSTTYGMLTIISLVLLGIFYFTNHFLNWNKILNVNNFPADDLSKLALIIFIFFCLQFVIQIINTVLTASHAPSKVSLINFLGQLGCLIAIYVLSKNTHGSLLYLITALAGIPLLVQLVSSIWFYANGYKNFAPSLKLIRFKYTKDLLKIGGVFFVIQIGALILFQTDNIIITQLFGPAKVTAFNVAYKLFAVITMAFTVIITPFWSAFTDAYTQGDIEWIKSIFLKMNKLWYLLIVLVAVLLAASPFIYHIWLHDSVIIPFSLSIAMAFYVIVYIWQTMHAYFLNGIAKVRLQLYLVVTSAIINIPLGIFLGKTLGLAGITLSNAILFVIMGWLLSVQTKKIINSSATGIWNK